MNTKNSTLPQVLLKNIKITLSEFYTYSYAFKNREPNIKKFVVFGQGRTGSTLLFDLINSHSQINGNEDAKLTEILYKKVVYPKLFVEGKALKSQAPVYGFKLKTIHLLETQKHINPLDFVLNLHQTGWKLIHLNRINLLASAISTQVAAQRQIWHSNSVSSDALAKVFIDFDALTKNIELREFWLKKENEIIENIPHLKIYYENDLLQQQTHQKTADNIFEYLELNKQGVKSNLKKTVDLNLEKTIINYQEILKSLEKSKYSKYLELYKYDLKKSII